MGRAARAERALGAAGLVLALAWGGRLGAEEGMWTFDRVPAAQMRARYGFAPDGPWLEHQRLAALRFPGASGSFISPDGLVLTNHHVAHAWLTRLSDAAHDYVRDGFLAADRNHELRVPGLEVRTLRLMRDVTADLARAGAPGNADPEAVRARQAVLDRLVREEEARTGWACEPVSLFQGGETWIYGYEVHDDVRLVMAPEYAIAAFGMDWDNFTYPRHDLDFALFRVYRDGRPYHPDHYLRWARTGLGAGDLTLVVGHPGRTTRLETVAQLEAVRDVTGPLRLRSLDRLRQARHAFAGRSPDHARRVSAQLLSVENAYKATQLEAEALADPELRVRAEAAERALRSRVAADPALQARAGASWDRIAQAVRDRSAVARESLVLEARASRVLAWAQDLVRWKREAAKPLAQRAAGYRTRHDLARAQAALDVRSPFDPELEQADLAAALEEALAELGPEHPISRALLGGQAPADRARALAGATRLLDPAVRGRLARTAPGPALADPDPLLVLAGHLLDLAEPIRARVAAAEAVIAEQGARIAQARFALDGREAYPDATFSLRLSYGSVQPVPGNGTLLQPFTTFGGLFDRADAWGPGAEDHSWDLPARWRRRRAALDPSTPFNFISSNDIVGGNSGSPVVDRAGNLVGLVFDGNAGSMSGRFAYDPRNNRAVSLDARAILESLAKVYDAPGLVAEILGTGGTPVAKGLPVGTEP